MDIANKIKRENNLQEMYAYIDNADDTKFSPSVKEITKEMLEATIEKENDINLSFDDFKYIMNYGEVAFGGTGESNGKNLGVEAVKQAIANASLNDKSIEKISGILQFVTHPITLCSSIIDILNGVELLYNIADSEDMDIVFGITTDEHIAKEYVKVRILVTAFKAKINTKKFNR